jgi:hypothetical protein
VFRAWADSATAFDNEDGDITGDITTNEGSLSFPLTDVNTPQFYTWTIVDSSGQTDQATRQIDAAESVAPEDDEGRTGLNISLSLEI